MKAEEINIEFEKIKKLRLDKDDLTMMRSASSSSGRLIRIYSLPGNNFAVPSLFDKTHENPLEFIHLRNLTCPLNVCKEKRSKLHTLMKKEGPICLHTLIVTSITTPDGEEKQAQSASKSAPNPKIDRDLTTKFVVQKIKEFFPSMTDETRTQFLAFNRKFTTSLVQSEDLSSEINKHVPSTCQFCVNTDLVDWPYQPSRSFFMSMAYLSEIQIHVKTCPLCKIAYYPDLYDKGLFPIHNKFLLSYDLLMDVYNLLVTSSSLVENIAEKIILLGKCNGVSEDILSISQSNNAKNIEKASIAIIAALGKMSNMHILLN